MITKSHYFFTIGKQNEYRVPECILNKREEKGSDFGFRNVRTKVRRFLLIWNKEGITCNLVFEKAPLSLLFFLFTIKVHIHRPGFFFPFKFILLCNSWIAHLKIKWYSFKSLRSNLKELHAYLQATSFLKMKNNKDTVCNEFKPQIHMLKCLYKIHRILSFIISTRTVQRQIHCFGQERQNPELILSQSGTKNQKSSVTKQSSNSLPRELGKLPNILSYSWKPGNLKGCFFICLLF